jgi:Cu/Ag efflux protein CusF
MNTRHLLRGALPALALTIALAACGGDKTAEVRTISGPTKTYESHGTVTKIDEENNRVTLDHEQIGDWMEPMKMPFPVSDPALLEGLETGKRYAFTVVVGGQNNADYMITRLTPAQ